MQQATSCKKVFSALLAVLVLVGAAAAQEKKPSGKALDRKTLDESIYQSLRGIIDHGADLYNQGDWNGCYRLWEGALMSLKPMLDHRPKLQEAINGGLSKARQEAVLWQRAWALRPILDKIRSDINADYPHKRKRDTGEPPLAAEKKREEKKPEEKKQAGKASITGHVTLKGQPLKGGTVVYTSKESKIEGKIAADGTYSVEGVKPGVYKVSVQGEKGVAVPAAFTNPETSGLTYNVIEGRQTFDIALQ